MRLEHERAGRTLIVRVSGSLDVHTADAFREQVDAWFLASDATRLVLNLSRVEFLDSTGLGAVLGRARRAWAAGRELALVPPSGVARSVLDALALARTLPLFRSERLAVGEEAAADG